MPARTVPKMNVPLIDKWTHFILFGVFAYLWLLSVYRFRLYHLGIVFFASVVLGWLVEVIQGALVFLGRSQDNMDTLADAVGGMLGVFVFYMVYWFQKRKLQ
jgi:VanZ family protein